MGIFKQLRVIVTIGKLINSRIIEVLIDQKISFQRNVKQHIQVAIGITKYKQYMTITLTTDLKR